MTKAELRAALDRHFEDDERVVCVDELGIWDNISRVGFVGSTAAIVYDCRYAPFNEEETVSITKNGEVVYDPQDGKYKVYDKAHNEYVCTTRFKQVAFAAWAEYTSMQMRS